MKNNRKKSIAKITLAIFSFALIILSGCGQNKNKNENTGFKILIESSLDGIKLTGKEGCKFTELSFSLVEDKVESINQFGMIMEENANINNEENMPTFLITMKKTNGEIVLEGIKGTTWKNLSFSCPELGCTQLIDENGMSDIK